MLLLTTSIAATANANPAETLPLSRFCIVAETGQVLIEENADLVRPPASMVKLMTMLLAVEGIEAGRWRLDTPIYISANAQRMGGTQIFLKAGQTWPLEKLLQAMAVASANDAALAVAEGLFGGKYACLSAMNRRAQELDMDATQFNSVHGLPPDKGEQPDRTTARDMAKLARECIRHPLMLQLTSLREMSLGENSAVATNTNKLLLQMEGCDGLKTGYIRAAGFCLTATAVRNGTRLITVVMGANSNSNRFALTQELMETAFAAINTQQQIAALTNHEKNRPWALPKPAAAAGTQLHDGRAGG